MDNDILNKCVTQGNNLAQICTALHQRLTKVEEQNAKLIQLNSALLQRVVSLEKVEPKPVDSTVNDTDVEVNKIARRMDTIEQSHIKIKDSFYYLDIRVNDIERAIADIPAKVDAITATVNDTKAMVMQGKGSKASKRTPRTYEMYQRVMQAQEGGMSMKLIAKEMDIPYTTVVSYFKMSQDEIDALPHEQEQGNE